MSTGSSLFSSTFTLSFETSIFWDVTSPIDDIKIIRQTIVVGTRKLETIASKIEINKKTLNSIETKPNFDKIINATIQIKVGNSGGTGVLIKEDKNFLYALSAKHITDIKGEVSVCLTDLTNDKKGFAEG